MRPLPVILALLALSLAGCAGEETPYGVTGHFTGDHSDEDIEEVRRLAEERGGELVVLESSPEQFQARGMSLEECEAFRSEVEQKPYVDRVDGCAEVEAGADPY